MNEHDSMKIKLAYVSGLRDIVFDEVKQTPEFKIIKEGKDCLYVEYADDFEKIKKLYTVSRAYISVENLKYHPIHIAKHKSILGNLVQIVIEKNKKGDFKTFNINCAGSNSDEVKEIKKYISSEFKLEDAEEADLKIYIAKVNETWEISIQITPRPLSVREYKIKNMSGAMDATVASTLNSLCNLGTHKTYLNIFSGSATLLIEAGLQYENLQKLIGFDSNKEHLSLSIQNIKKAGLIKKIKVHEHTIFENPDLGNFDVITSDLPFGMSISKGEDLEKLYETFIKYCENHLNSDGTLAVYTSEFELFERLISESKFVLKKEVKVNLVTSERQYLPVKIMVFEFKGDLDVF
jgi:23S rRNA G2445 N2-methylase RlmL